MPSRASIPDQQHAGPQPALFDTSVRIWRYLLIVPLSQHALQQVAAMKKELEQHIGTFRDARSRAHLTLLFLYVPEEYERMMCGAIQLGVQGHGPIEMVLKGPAWFPGDRTIHLEVQGKEPLRGLRKQVLARLRAHDALKDLGVHATQALRVSLARKLSAEQFARAQEFLRGHERVLTEKAGSLVLVRGGPDRRHYAVVREFSLV